ncbi:MAG: hypothetical protein ACRYFY_09195 [Janthinobacterium lividum]
MTTTPDPKQWAVSRSRHATLARPLTEADDTTRFSLLANAVRDLATEEDVVLEIDKLWGEVQDKFLAIGRYLVAAKTKFHRSFEATILPQLPFGKGVAYQLRAIAVAVDDGRLLEIEMPRSYATAYQLVSLPPTDFDLARRENLVRRDVMRREVNAFRVKLKNMRDDDNSVLLIRERDRLHGDIQRIQERLAVIDAELRRVT